MERPRLGVPFVIVFVTGGDAKGDSIGDLTDDLLGDAIFWLAFEAARWRYDLIRFGKAAQQHGSDFDAVSTDFDGMHRMHLW